MMNTLGQYYPSNSLIHRLDPRVKLIGTLVFIVALFLSSKYQSIFISALFACSMIRISKVPFAYIAKQLKVVIVILILSSIFNIFLTQGTDILITFGPIVISVEGIKKAVFIAIRLVLLVMGTSLLTFTSTPTELTDGLETGLSPLKKLRLPIHEMTMMMSIALRFIPVLIEETDHIIKAQKARGADFETGNIFVRAKNLIPLLVPLFVAAFRRSDELALAMDSRCYHGGNGRTKLNPLVYTRKDRFAYIVIFFYLAISILIKIFL